MEVVFWLSAFWLYYVYDGYLRLLRLMVRFIAPRKNVRADQTQLTVTILLTVFNEKDKIIKRLDNIFDTDFPVERLQVIVASDGSTDSTDRLVKYYNHPRVCLIRPLKRRGKTDTQNQAIATASGDILIFTDADTIFDRSFIANIVAEFEDPRVGGADGRCIIMRNDESGISRSQVDYWSRELCMRELEGQMGILAVGSGACLAIKRILFQPMSELYGEDCILPLHVVSQGYRFVHASSAIAYDTWPCDIKGELKSRIRTTLRNWQGTWSRPELLNPIRNPGIAFSLWSHKLLRWLSPLALICMTISSLLLALQDRQMFLFISTGLGLFYLSGVVGWWAEWRGRHLPLVTRIYSFLLANTGFLIGLWRSALGHAVTTYRH
jgi:cellulose synthase/poly-beta-1,6-N-acetylglucosamine synthase-like glycosyltransferase